MEYIVIKEFYDRFTLEHYVAGDKYACNDGSRADHLLMRGYIAEPVESKEDVEEAPEKPQKAAKTTAKRAVKKKA